MHLVIWMPKKIKLANCKGIYLTSDLIQSDAFQSLTKLQTNVFWGLLARRTYPNQKMRKKVGNVIENQGQIIFTYKQAMRDLGIAKDTFTRAINKLIEVGLIEIAVQGGDNKGHKYRVCFGCDDTKDKWKDYPRRNWKRPKSNNLVGKGTRFSKNTRNDKGDSKVEEE